jgi:hypothetical protein
MGKTVLLSDAADRARLAGMRVLSVTGRESESRLAFAGLHQLLRPVLSSAAGLPGRQAQALSGALGLSAGPGAPDPLLTGVAVLTLLSDLSERSPVLVVADDAHCSGRAQSVRGGGRRRARRTRCPRGADPPAAPARPPGQRCLTNREIGDRLFLSPRTVSSYLYRSYPKLGVAGRHQLRDVIALTSTPTTAHASTGSETLL